MFLEDLRVEDEGKIGFRTLLAGVSRIAAEKPSGPDEIRPARGALYLTIKGLESLPCGSWQRVQFLEPCFLECGLIRFSSWQK